MLNILCLFAADSGRRAKVSRMNYPHQDLLEMLIADFRKKSIFQERKRWHSSYSYIEVCEWIGVKCTENGDVKSINWDRTRLEGTVAFEHLPSSTERFRVFQCHLSGTLNMEEIHPPMSELCLSKNFFEGTIAFDQLPETMGTLDLSRNKFSGKVNLLDLPEGLCSLDLSDNEFSGEIRIPHIPSKMHRCDLSGNSFGNDAHIGEFPPSLFEIDLRKNHVQRAFDLEGVMHPKKRVHVSR